MEGSERDIWATMASGTSQKPNRASSPSTPLDYGITNHLLRDGSSAPHFVRFLTNLINRQSTVVFVGAHIGVYVVPIAKIAERVYGYESDPRNYRYLEYNLRLNSCNNVQCFNLAVGDTARTVAVEHNQANSGGSTISIDPPDPLSSTTRTGQHR